jgi:hypothetical protein
MAGCAASFLPAHLLMQIHAQLSAFAGFWIHAQMAWR